MLFVVFAQHLALHFQRDLGFFFWLHFPRALYRLLDGFVADRSENNATFNDARQYVTSFLGPFLRSGLDDDARVFDDDGPGAALEIPGRFRPGVGAVLMIGDVLTIFQRIERGLPIEHVEND